MSNPHPQAEAAVSCGHLPPVEGRERASRPELPQQEQHRQATCRPAAQTRVDTAATDALSWPAREREGCGTGSEAADPQEEGGL